MISRPHLLPLLLALFLAPTVADTVYRTVDEQGRVSFSDQPPAGAESVEILQIEPPAPAGDDQYQQNLAAMRETTDRMAADRREREALRRAEREQAREPDKVYYPVPVYAGPYRPTPYPAFVRPPHRPAHRPRPPRPPEEPARPQRLRDNLYNNSQLMRPLLPRRDQ